MMTIASFPAILGPFHTLSPIASETVSWLGQMLVGSDDYPCSLYISLCLIFQNMLSELFQGEMIKCLFSSDRAPMTNQRTYFTQSLVCGYI